MIMFMERFSKENLVKLVKGKVAEWKQDTCAVAEIGAAEEYGVMRPWTLSQQWK